MHNLSLDKAMSRSTKKTYLSKPMCAYSTDVFHHSLSSTYIAKVRNSFRLSEKNCVKKMIWLTEKWWSFWETGTEKLRSVTQNTSIRSGVKQTKREIDDSKNWTKRILTLRLDILWCPGDMGDWVWANNYLNTFVREMNKTKIALVETFGKYLVAFLNSLSCYSSRLIVENI